MNITIPGLSEKDNEEFNCLLEQFATGVYWEQEGWSVKHLAMRPEAEQQLQDFFNRTK